MSKLIIDASNLRAGGGIVHLQNILRFGNPQAHGFRKVIVYGGRIPLESLHKQDWLDLREVGILNKTIFHRLLWQQKLLGHLAKKENALLFVPGGLYLGDRRPYVTMCQNMLPFEHLELKKYFISGRYLRMKMLTHGQKKTFINANGIIFLSKYTEQILSENLRIPNRINTTVIPHATNKEFRLKKDFKNPPKNILCVSTIDIYKRQIEVVKAVDKLRNKLAFDVNLHLVGSAYKPYEKKLIDLIKTVDSKNLFIKYYGEICHSKLPKIYQEADIFVFASTCETFGISLLEAMSSGLPIACSNRKPMSDILQDAGVYFNPDKSDSIFESLSLLFKDESLRRNLGLKARLISESYSWKRSAKDTFSFLQCVYQKHLS